MKSRYTNPCIRCGKQRIDSKSWKETIISYVGKSVIVHTETVCPDSECQKIVEEKLAIQRKKSETMLREKSERIKHMQEARKHIKI